MRLVELTHFPSNEFRRSNRLLVNPDHVIFVVEAQGDSGDQCWLRLAHHEQDFLIEGSVDEIAEKLTNGYDPSMLRETG